MLRLSWAVTILFLILICRWRIYGPDCLNTQAVPKYDPLLQVFVWFEDDSIVDSNEGSETNVNPQGLIPNPISSEIYIEANMEETKIWILSL